MRSNMRTTKRAINISTGQPQVEGSRDISLAQLRQLSHPTQSCSRWGVRNTGGEVPPDAHPRHRGQRGRRLAAAGRGERGQHAQHHPRGDAQSAWNARPEHMALSHGFFGCDAEHCAGARQTCDGDWRRCRVRRGRARRPACCAWRTSCWGRTTATPSWSSTPQTTGARGTHCGVA